MSRLTDLIEAVKKESPNLGEDLASEIKSLMNRRSFGLVFERHKPEAVELPGLQIDVGSKVHILPPRGSTAKQDNRLWHVESLAGDTAHVTEQAASDPEARDVPVEDLVAVAEFRDPIFPGLVETGRVERGGDKPYHSVINAENYHALEMLTYTHRHSIDAIYIDPPYNTGAKDWKYNNDYVEGDDDYRHSKWLAFMERRLKVARELLNPEDSVLVVTIDEKEVHRLGLLLEQTFPESRRQMLSININPAAVARHKAFGRSDEYALLVFLGDGGPSPLALAAEWVTRKGRTHTGGIRWDLMRRSGTGARRQDSPGNFYPIFISEDGERFVGVGESVPLGIERSSVSVPDRCLAVFPVRKDGTEGRWMLGPTKAREAITNGFMKIGALAGARTPIYYLAQGEQRKISEGTYEVRGYATDGSVITSVLDIGERQLVPGTQWNQVSHDATQYGSRLLAQMIGSGKFTFPKSLYAVEDVLRMFVKDKENAVVLDFFAGSGTTAHSVMRLNRQDGGRRQCISVTNNEVSADEQRSLRKRGLRPGDSGWEELGICEYVTKPRITTSITGERPDGRPLRGDYKFVDEFPMSEGFEENAVFYTLTYESALRVRYDLAFERIAPMLWLRAGARGRVIEQVGESGFEIADTYAVVKRPDRVRDFVDSLGDAVGIRIVYIVTDDSSVFQAVAQDLPEHVEAVQLYSSYLRNFEINRGRA